MATREIYTLATLATLPVCDNDSQHTMTQHMSIPVDAQYVNTYPAGSPQGFQQLSAPYAQRPLGTHVTPQPSGNLLPIHPQLHPQESMLRLPTEGDIGSQSQIHPLYQNPPPPPGSNSQVLSAYTPTMQQNFQPQTHLVQTTQPRAAPSMDLTNPNGIQRGANGEREWSNDLCGCFDDCGTCMLGVFCPCMLYAQMKSRLSYLTQKNQAHPEGGDMFSSDCFFHFCINLCFGMGRILQMSQRGTIRDRYRISGGDCGDCLTAFFCSSCQLTQESRELELEERALTEASSTYKA